MKKSWDKSDYEYISTQLRKITRGYDQHLVDDFIQEVLLIFFEHPLKDQLLESGDWKYYIIRIGLNNFHSKTSRFHKKYRSIPTLEYIENLDIQNEEYDIEYDMKVERVLTGLDKMLKSQIETHRSLAMIILLYYSTGESYTGLSRILETDRSNLSKNFKKGLDILKDYILDEINPTENVSKKLLNNKILKEIFMKKQTKQQVYEKWIKENRILFYNPSLRTKEDTLMLYEIYNYMYDTKETPTGCGACIGQKYNHFRELYFEN